MLKAIVGTTSVIAVALVFWAPTAQAATAKTLARQIQSAGLGCESPRSLDFKFWGGTKIRCDVNGEDIAVETYGKERIPAAMKMICAMGINIPILTDGRSWIVSPDSRATANQLKSVLGGKVVKTCSLVS